MIHLFNLPTYKISSSDFKHILHDPIVNEFENKFASYVGAKYACGASSATNLIMLEVIRSQVKNISIPTMIPPVVANGIITGGANVEFVDNVKWVGDSYTLYTGDDYKVVDSAQKVEKNQFQRECNPQDLMIFSLYPTKPVGSIDGGIIVSDDKEKIEWFKTAVFNGMSFAESNWERKIIFPGWKMYLNSIQAKVAMESLNNLEYKSQRLSDICDEYNSSFGYNNRSGHLYRVNVNDRKQVRSDLLNAGIITGIHYSCLHKEEAYKRDYTLNNSELESETTLSIPFHENLTSNQISHVVEKVKPFLS